jgi:adenine/guanine phosphoribosyltransferase-like PRPP-binding protein
VSSIKKTRAQRSASRRVWLLLFFRMAQQAAAAPTATTVTVAAPVADAVTLKLVPKRKKKKSVKWAEGVEEVDEFSGKRKSKSEPESLPCSRVCVCIK